MRGCVAKELNQQRWWLQQRSLSVLRTAFRCPQDASYSASTTYSRPNGKGVQCMFLVRVVVGRFCNGKLDALTPDVRKGHQLYDTTVNDVKNPAIFVTYHDAQVYPEYLIRFKQ